MHLATVDGEKLTEVLQRMSRIAGPVLGSAFWRFTDKVVIDWAGMQEPLEGQVENEMPDGLVVSGELMKGTGGRLTYSGPTAIVWADERLQIGRDRLPAEPAHSPRSITLPVGAEEGDLLVAILRRSLEEARLSGYTAECEVVEEKWGKSIGRAAKALGWTGLDESTLARAVAEALIAARSTGGQAQG